MTDRKELKEKYKSMKPEMGVFRVQSRISGNCYLYSAKDMKSLMNRYRFQLARGSHPDRRLHAEWSEQGADNFIVEVLERLEYDQDETKSDYAQDLELLRMIWQDKLAVSNEA
jgi:hypothetical protein